METIFTTLCIQFGNRSSAKKKIRFLNWAIAWFQKQGYAVEVMNDKAKYGRVCDVLFGDINKAKQLIVVPYDTPLKLSIPNSMYFPLHGNKNRKIQMKSLAIQTICSFLWLLVAFLFMYVALKQATIIKYSMMLLSFVCFLLAFFIGKGIGNRYNFNRNHAAIAVAMELAKKKSDATAFVFVDATTQSYKGYLLLQSKYEKVLEQKKIICLDCIGNDDPCHILTTKPCSQKDLQPYWHTIDTDEDTVLSIFKNGYLVTRARYEEKEWCVYHTGTRKDTYVNFDSLRENVTLLQSLMKSK